MSFDFNSDTDRDIARTFGSLAKNGGGWKSEAQARYWFNQFDRVGAGEMSRWLDEKHFATIDKLEPGQKLLVAEGVLRFQSRHTGGLTGVGAKFLSWFYVIDGKGLVSKWKAGHKERGGGLTNEKLEFVRVEPSLFPDYWAQIEAKRAEVAKLREAEYLAAEVAPAGRVEVTGRVVNDPEWRASGASRYGREFGAFKCIVRDDRGFKVWTSVPSRADWQKGDEVKFTVTLEPSVDDPKFAFGKRPTIKKEAS